MTYTGISPGPTDPHEFQDERTLVGLIKIRLIQQPPDDLFCTTRILQPEDWAPVKSTEPAVVIVPQSAGQRFLLITHKEMAGTSLIFLAEIENKQLTVRQLVGIVNGTPIFGS